MLRDRRARELEERAYEFEWQRLQLAERVVALRERELTMAESMAERGARPWKPSGNPRRPRSLVIVS
jgi:hypothetical protein